MIQALPSQPIDFIGPRFPSCGDEKPSPLLMTEDDTLIFQFISGRCSNASELIADTTFESWSTFGLWSIKANDACVATGSDGSYIAWDSFNPTVGDIYEIEFVVTSISGTLNLTIGGFEQPITAPGTYNITFVAETTEKAIIYVVGDATSACLYSFSLYDGNEAVSVTLKDAADVELFSASFNSDPQYFTLNGSHLTFTLPLAGLEIPTDTCFKVFLNDNCFYEPTELCSQSILFGPCGDTVKIRVCNDEDQPDMGFVAGRFEIRLPFNFIRPTYSYDVDDQKLTNGTTERGNISRSQSWEMNLQDVFTGGSTHAFLSAMPLFDHLYIGDFEYILKPENYEPSYADSSSNLGAVSLVLSPKVDLFAKRKCEAEGPGCDPKNDPICNAPQARIRGRQEDDGFFIGVNVFGSLGFVPGDLIAIVNGVEDAPIALTPPQQITLGPYVPGDIIVVKITNADDPECDYIHPSIEAPYQCGAPFVNMVGSDGVTYPQLNATYDYTATVVNGKTKFAVDAVGVNKTIAWFVTGDGVPVDRWVVIDEDDPTVAYVSEEDTAYPCQVDIWYAVANYADALPMYPNDTFTVSVEDNA